MSLQSDDLSMTGLGVAQDQPADPYQAPLTDGIHLRWGFRRELGFPWHGFYLFRRPARPGTPLCLSAVTGGLKQGGSPGSNHHTAIGALSSDVNLVLTDDFAPSDRVEFDLDGRRFLRFELPEGEPARRVELSVGFRRACMSVGSLIQPPVMMAPGQTVTRASPLTAQGVTFQLVSLKGGAQFTVVNTAAGPLVGLLCPNRLTIKLSTPSDGVELLLTRANWEAAPTVEAYNGRGKLVASAQMQNPFNQPETIKLKGQSIVRVEVKQPVPNSAYLHRLCADAIRGEGQQTKVNVTAYSGTTPVRSVVVSGQSGKVVTTTIEADPITSVEIGPGPAALVDLCYVTVAQDATKGWERLSELSYPVGLPVTQPDYPCGVAVPQALLPQRVRHPWPPGWDASAFTELHDQLVELVKGGPGSAPMVDRIFAAPQSPANPQDPDPPQLSKFYILDMILLGSLHPALAQAVGLYWVDRTAANDAAYDYLIVADHTGVGQRDPGQVLNVIQSSGFAQLDGYIVFNKRAAAEPPLPPPTGLEAYELPGGTFPDAEGQLPQSSNNAGLRWDVGLDSSGELLPQSAVMYLVWRADLGNATTPAPAVTHDLVTKLPPDEPRPIMVSESRVPNGLVPERPPDWPQAPLHFIDRNLKDGWYGYRLSGIDLFGRHSAQGAPVQLRLLDRIPPPSPTGVEAYALDPEDPYLQKDIPYQAWRDSLDGSVRQTLVGLRVRWRWTTAHRRQHLDTREFRIYFHPGAILPDARDRAVNWQERYFVVDYENHFRIDPLNDDRVYEVFLPPADSANLVSIPLNPTLAEPVVYAHVGVSAADDKQHASDLRPGGDWGARPGNEGRVGPPAKIYRVRRALPPPPEDVLGGERLYASPADYLSRSFFTYHWKPQPYTKLHVFRALDDGVFKADWAQRHLRPVLDASHPDLFPPGWNAATRQSIADELNHLNTFADLEDGAGPAQAAGYYRQLSDAALRVLAGLPTSEAAFVQLTINPLDPGDAANADRKGPDTPDDFLPDPNHRAFIDTLDGRATNRYFYRAAYVDGAHNLGPLGLVSPPVYLPNVVPPRTPVVTKVLGGDRQITLKWASNREPDLAEYRVYRAGTEQAQRDLRLMTLVHTETVPPGEPMARPAESAWVDTPAPGSKKYYYRLCAVDDVGNRSEPSPVVVGQAYDYGPPGEPVWLRSEWVRLDESGREHPWEGGEETLAPSVALAFTTSQENVSALIERYDGSWRSITQWMRAAAYDDTLQVWRFTLYDRTAEPTRAQQYRITLMTNAGVSLVSEPARQVPTP
jgi:hypothetical protein